MHHAMVVGRLERAGDVERHVDRLPPGKPSPRAEQLFEAPAADDLHREVWLPRLLSKCEELHDARVPQRLEGLDLGCKPSP